MLSVNSDLYHFNTFDKIKEPQVLSFKSSPSSPSEKF
jgi:hypothetical protein